MRPQPRDLALLAANMTLQEHSEEEKGQQGFPSLLRSTSWKVCPGSSNTLDTALAEDCSWKIDTMVRYELGTRRQTA